MSYVASICKATGVDASEAAIIERLMRVERPTLDALDAREFRLLARESCEALQYLRECDPEVADFYAEEAR